MIMQSGDYNQPFELVKTSVEVDDYGDQQKVDSVVYRGYAKVLNLSGREYWEAFAVHQEETLKFQTRWAKQFDDIDTTTHWIRWHGKLLNIVAVDNIAYSNAMCQFRVKVVD